MPAANRSEVVQFMNGSDAGLEQMEDLQKLSSQLTAQADNAIDAGDETARGLGVRVERVRMTGMLVASALTAAIISCLGIIGFVGLVVPHMVRRLIGADHRFLLPASILAGGLLLLVADTVARLLLAPHVLPVSVLTAFLGAPVFLVLILRGGRR